MTPAHQRLLGAILIGLGISAWAPFLVLIGLGRPVSIFPFLGVHLAGVLSGAWLRNNANQKEGLSQGQTAPGRKRRIASIVLIYLGVLAWAPYFYLDKFLNLDTPVAPFLVAHLTGVLGGAALRASAEMERFRSPK